MSDGTNYPGYWEPPKEGEEAEAGRLGIVVARIMAVFAEGTKMTASGLFGGLVALEFSQTLTGLPPGITWFYAGIFGVYLLITGVERMFDWEGDLRMKELNEEQQK